MMNTRELLKKYLFGKAGISLVEVMFVAVIYLVIMITIFNAWMLTHKGWSGEKERTAIRIDILKSVEKLKADTRLSSITYMSFYPANGEYYTAVSMPQAVVDQNGFFSLDGFGNIIWDKTIIYHIAESGGEKSLKRTVIDSWDSGLDGDERYDQLSRVVSGLLSGSSSEVLIEDVLDSFEITASASDVDFYADVDAPVKVKKAVLGMAMLSSGQHSVGFTVTGKDDVSTGYVIGVDAIYLDPCDSQRDAEYYLSAAAPANSWDSSGKPVTVVNDAIWGNSNYVRYQAGEEDDFIEFSDYYDLNRDSTFSGATLNNVIAAGGTVYAKLEFPADRAEGEEDDIVWKAANQEGGQVVDPEDDDLPGYPITIRTAVKNEVINNEGIEYGETERADMVRVKFASSSQNPLKIEAAYITRRDGVAGENGLRNLSSSGKEINECHFHQQLFFRDQYDGDDDGNTTEMLGQLWIPPDSEAYSEWVAFPLTLQNGGGQAVDYFITFCVPDLETAVFPSGWDAFNPAYSDCVSFDVSGTHSYCITEGDFSTQILPAAGAPVWTGVYTTASCDKIYVSTEIDAWQKHGIVESRVIDTMRTSSDYSQIKWTETSPAGTEVTMKARSADEKDMADATDWADVTGSVSNPQTPMIGNGKYVQYRAEMSSELSWKWSAGTMSYADYIDEQAGFSSPWVFPSRSGEYLESYAPEVWIDDVELRWLGGGVMCKLKCDLAKSRDGGRAVVTVDGKELISFLSVHLSVIQEIDGVVVSDDATFGMKPRNTYK